jgi:Icc protein
MLIAQLSDPHIRVGPLAGEAAAHLHRALGRVLALGALPDCVVITGDIAENGTAEEYENFRSVVGDFPLPVYLASGNHDDAATLVSCFAGTTFLGGGASSYYALQHPDATVVVLDSSVAGRLDGHLDAAQLGWLDATLAGRRETPAVLCLHHPPMPVGLGFLDSIRLDNPADLAAVLAGHDNVVRILAGHVHRSIVADFAGTTVTVAPSTFRQAALSLHSADPAGYVYEPPGFLLHLIGTDGCLTHNVATMQAAGAIGHF